MQLSERTRGGRILGQSSSRSPEAIALVDCNNFFVSCERAFAPALKSVPVVVLSNNDGCVISRSNEAKQIGIKMGEPYFKCKSLVETHRVKVFSSNFELYGDLSSRVHQIIARFARRIEVYSVDEAFITLPSLPDMDLEMLGHEIKSTILKWTGIPVTVGIATTKTLAKAAVELAKNNTGVLSLYSSTQPQIDVHLKKLPVEGIWGVGRRFSATLNAHNLRTAYDFTQAPHEWVRKTFTVVGSRTHQELRGIRCFDLSENHSTRKSLIVSRSFSHPVYDFTELMESVATYTSRATEKLREEHLLAKQIAVFVSDKKQYRQSQTIALSSPSNFTPSFIAAAEKSLLAIYKKGIRYKKTGVIITGISSDNPRQLDLFSSLSAGRRELAISHSLDSLNARYGRHTLQFLAAGLNKHWYMRREHKSKECTTRWSELVVAS